MLGLVALLEMNFIRCGGFLCFSYAIWIRGGYCGLTFGFSGFLDFGLLRVWVDLVVYLSLVEMVRFAQTRLVLIVADRLV